MIGLALAMLMRLALLASLAWVIRLTRPLFAVLGQEISGRDLILIAGGLFLLAKATHEIHRKLEGAEEFSLDSVITAVGMANRLIIMVLAVVIAVGFMMLFARPIGDFVENHPTVKMLALSFLLLIGTALIADGFDLHIPKGYIYFAMGFSVFVEMLNLRLRSRSEPVKLHEPFSEETG
jgi:predicted tellurium resistance membrane protein TerC